MKFSYSLIKEFVPGLPSKKKLIGELNAKSFETEDIGGDTLDISLPANRYSDAASHWGIGKEASAIFGLRLKTVKGIEKAVNLLERNGLIAVKIERPDLCQRYKAALLSLDKHPSSPAWMKNRLAACGLRPINMVVDVMNYAMLETGQPLHAFDYDKLAGEKKKTIVVRPAGRGEKMETLDGKKFDLEDDLLIADYSAPLAIAGIKGGKKAEIDGSTRRILIESANFYSTAIYKTMRRLNLVTDASLRFSRDLSPELAEYGMNRAIILLKELAGAKIIDSVDYYPKPKSREVIGFSLSKLNSVLGTELSKNEAISILKKLGMEIAPARKSDRKFDFLVEPPEIRVDIETFEDLTEEVGRICGYNKIKPKAPVVAIKPGEFDDSVSAKERCRNILVSFGFSEMYSYSFFSGSSSEWIWSSSPKEKKMLEIQNPIAEDKKYLRGELTSGILKALDDNARNFDEVRVFELGKIFNAGGERLRISLGVNYKNASAAVIKGVVGKLLDGFGLTDVFFRQNSPESLLIESDHNVIGQIVSQENDRRGAAELDLDEVIRLSSEEFEYKPLPRYPSIIRDLSLEFDEDVLVGDVLDAINQARTPYLWNVDVADYYDARRITLRLVFQAEDRTLKDLEADSELAAILGNLKRKFALTVR